MDLNLKNLEFLYSLHGQVPGMLDWDFENEFVLPCTTDQCLLTEQNLLKHRFLAMNPPQVPQKRKASLNKDEPHIEPNLWMWVNPNIVCPLGIQGFPNPSDKNDLRSMCPFPQPLTMDKESSCSEAAVVDCQPFFRSDQSPKVKHFTSSICELEFTEEKVKEREDNSSAALQFPNKECIQQQKSWQIENQEIRSWSRPPLNYGHLIALALRNGSPSGLNVQDIYNFIRQHFPFFQTAPGGWKNTIRHNLCFLGSFRKVPVRLQDEINARPRACLWILTEEGHRRFQEETRPLASARKQIIQKCMSQPDVMTSLFNL